MRVPMFEKALTRMLFRSPRSTAPSQTDTCGAQRRQICSSALCDHAQGMQ